MTSKRRLPVILAGLTLGLFACEQSITSPVIPAVEYQPVESLALVHGSCVTPGAGLLSWWPGNGTFDDVALDAANNIGFNSRFGVRTAQLEEGDVTFESGLVGQAFSFTPVTGAEFLEIPDAVDLRPASFTVDLWAMRTGNGHNAGDAFGNVVIQKAIGNTTNQGISYGIWWNGAGEIKAGVDFGSVFAVLESGLAFGNGAWVHIALTVDGSMARLYLNGAEVASAAGGAPVYGPGSVVLGSSYELARAVGFPRSFHGLIDEVDLFGRALDAGEVAEIYHAGANGKCSGDGEVSVYPLTIDQATVRLDKQGRHDKDAFDVDGRLPLDLLQDFDPDSDEVTVTFAEIVQSISAGSFVRKDDKWRFEASDDASGIQRIDFHFDGRFKIEASGPFDVDWSVVDFGNLYFSLSIGSYVGESGTQLDPRLHFRSHGGDDESDHDDDVDFDDDGEGHSNDARHVDNRHGNGNVDDSNFDDEGDEDVDDSDDDDESHHGHRN